MASTSGRLTVAMLLAATVVARSATVSQAAPEVTAPQVQPPAQVTAKADIRQSQKTRLTPGHLKSRTTAASRPRVTAVASRSPLGVPGRWRQIFDDEFSGQALNTKLWVTHDGWTKQNRVTTLGKNVYVFGGQLHLVLSDAQHGSAIATAGSRTNFGLPVGGVAEASIYFPSNGSGACSNWPAWWVSGPKAPRAGEHDIAEVLGGRVSVVYHSPSGAHNKGTISGAFCGKWHSFGLHRMAHSAEVLLDGRVVKRYPTDDNGAPECLILSHGAHLSPHTGLSNAVRVDFVRAWAPAS